MKVGVIYNHTAFYREFATLSYCFLQRICNFKLVRLHRICSFD